MVRGLLQVRHFMNSCSRVLGTEITVESNYIVDFAERTAVTVAPLPHSPSPHLAPPHPHPRPTPIPATIIPLLLLYDPLLCVFGMYVCVYSVGMCGHMHIHLIHCRLR